MRLRSGKNKQVIQVFTAGNRSMMAESLRVPCCHILDLMREILGKRNRASRW